jgi:hypothetical protein
LQIIRDAVILKEKSFGCFFMKFAKLLVVAAIIVVAAVLAFTLIGFLMNIAWYLLIFGGVGLLGYAAYKMFLEKRRPRAIERTNERLLDDKTFDRDFARADRLLSEYKKKLNSEK